MTMPFHDHFSANASGYAAHRPTYPDAVARYLAANAPGRELALDVGCGNGQLSCLLARGFRRVRATDASAAQIRMAQPHPGVEYVVAPAEHSGLPDRSCDLIAAAQAVHWFSLDAFYTEVRRVGRPGALVALICYAPLFVDDDIRGAINNLYYGTLASYWPPERRLVEAAYSTIPFPFEELPPAPFLHMEECWNLASMMGYIETWSAVQELKKSAARGLFDEFRAELCQAWGDPDKIREIQWPLALRVGRL